MQVHFLVRENLLAIDELRDTHDKIYDEIHECFGLERCRKQENFIDGPPPRKIQKVLAQCGKVSKKYTALCKYTYIEIAIIFLQKAAL